MNKDCNTCLHEDLLSSDYPCKACSQIIDVANYWTPKVKLQEVKKPKKLKYLYGCTCCSKTYLIKEVAINCCEEVSETVEE